MGVNHETAAVVYLTPMGISYFHIGEVQGINRRALLIDDFLVLERNQEINQKKKKI